MATSQDRYDAGSRRSRQAPDHPQQRLLDHVVDVGVPVQRPADDVVDQREQLGHQVVECPSRVSVARGDHQRRVRSVLYWSRASNSASCRSSLGRPVRQIWTILSMHKNGLDKSPPNGRPTVSPPGGEPVSGWWTAESRDALHPEISSFSWLIPIFCYLQPACRSPVTGARASDAGRDDRRHATMATRRQTACHHGSRMPLVLAVPPITAAVFGRPSPPRPNNAAVSSPPRGPRHHRPLPTATHVR